MWWLYQVLLVVAWPVVLVRLRWRARREPAYGQRIAERFGHAPPDVPAGTIWFHTVSAGETIAAAPLIGALASANPGWPVLVTTMTPTGSAQVTARLTGAEPGVHHCYAPYDFPWGVRRFFDRVQPRLLVLMETELWPNLIDTAARRACRCCWSLPGCQNGRPGATRGSAA
jgi:3-deoxy-D-manno-octulosonic-acid transferase